MTIDSIYQYVQAISNKDVAGNAFSPGQFNNLLEFENIELFQTHFQKAKALAAKEEVPLSDVLFNTSDLRNFIAEDVPAALSQVAAGGLTRVRMSYPTNFEYPISLIADNKPVDIKSTTALTRIRSGVLNQNFNEHPVAVQLDGVFELYPNDLTTLLLTYLKTPTTPYYDYCLSVDSDAEVFMPVGSYVVYVPAQGQYNLYASDDSIIQEDVTHTYFDNSVPNSGVTYTSVTAELEWNETQHITIANRILEKLGVNLRSPEVTQYAMTQDK